MDRSCGNCAMTLDETERLVQCKPDLLPAVWHRKDEVCRNCEYFRPKELELHLRMVCLRAEYYQGDNRKPVIVFAECEGGREFEVDVGKVAQARLAGWVKSDRFYTENENRYRRETWRPRSGSQGGLPIVVSTKDELCT